MQAELWKRALGEFVGTFALVFAGTGAIVANDLSAGAVTHVGISLTFGLVVMAMIYAVGPLCGAHFNPAVSVGFWMSGRFPPRDLGVYIGTQCGAALAASLVLAAVVPAHESLGATVSRVGVPETLVLEGILTFFLVFVILRVATGAKEEGVMAGAAIGATVALGALAGGPLTGASMNPARSLGPAVVSGSVAELWLYIVGPLVGAVLAVVIFRLISHDRPVVAD